MFDKSRNVVVTGGTFTQVLSKEKDSFHLLQEAVSPAAFHDSGARYDAPKCYPNTRLAVLERISRWVKGLDAGTRDTSVMWLHGPAGAGKSAIAQTIAEAFSDEGEILASYFFSRLDPTRNHARSLIATIAYQICIHFPTVRSRVEGTIRADPLLLTRSMSTQMLHLIVHPLKELVDSGYFLDSKSRFLIVIDGLDECDRRSGQKDVLHSIADTLQNRHLPLKILIASRTEHDIVHALSSGYLLASSTRLALDDQYKPSADIELFLRGKFSEIKSNHPIKQHIPLDWPTDEAVNFLVDKSSGQFIYASTISRFIESARHSPLSRLEIVLGIRPSEKGQKTPFGELDALYNHIFGSVEDTRAVLKLLAVVILWELTQVDQLESLLGLSPGGTQLLLCDIQSLCFVEYSFRGAHVRLYHASLHDFLLDGLRSKGLHIKVPLAHARLIEHAFQFIESADFVRDACFCGVFFWEATKHIHEAFPTRSLYQILKHASPLSQAPGYYYDRRAADVIFFLWALQRSALPWAEEVYRHHIQSLHDYVEKQLGDYFSDPHITCMILLSTREETSLVFDRDSPRHLKFWLQWLSQPRKTDSAETLRSKSLLHLAVSLRTPDTATMSAILNDRADLGGYAIERDRMKVAALYLLKLIRKYSRVFSAWKIPSLPPQTFMSKRLPSPNILNKTRTHCPWKWRKMPSTTRGAKTSGSSRIKTSSNPAHHSYAFFLQERDSTVKTAIKAACMCMATTHFLLVLLPDLDYSAELVDFLRSPTCKFTLQLLGRGVARKAKKVINEYFRRVERVDGERSGSSVYSDSTWNVGYLTQRQGIRSTH